MDQEKKAEVIELFGEMTKVNNVRPRVARKARPTSHKGTTIIGSTIVVLNDKVAESVAKLLMRLNRS